MSTSEAATCLISVVNSAILILRVVKKEVEGQEIMI